MTVQDPIGCQALGSLQDEKRAERTTLPTLNSSVHGWMTDEEKKAFHDVEDFRYRNPEVTVRYACAKVGVPPDLYFQAMRKAVATRKEAFSITDSELIRPDSPIARRGKKVSPEENRDQTRQTRTLVDDSGEGNGDVPPESKTNSRAKFRRLRRRWL